MHRRNVKEAHASTQCQGDTCIHTMSRRHMHQHNVKEAHASTQSIATEPNPTEPDDYPDPTDRSTASESLCEAVGKLPDLPSKVRNFTLRLYYL